MGFFKLIFKFFTFWIGIDAKYQRLNHDERSVYLGVRSIIQSIICGVLCVLLLWGLCLCLKNLNDINAGNSSAGMPILTIVGIVVTAIGALSCFIQGLIGGLLYMVYQFTLNKRSVRWVALAVWIIVIIAVIVFALILFTNI